MLLLKYSKGTKYWFPFLQIWGNWFVWYHLLKAKYIQIQDKVSSNHQSTTDVKNNNHKDHLIYQQNTFKRQTKNRKQTQFWCKGDACNGIMFWEHTYTTYDKSNVKGQWPNLTSSCINLSLWTNGLKQLQWEQRKMC